MTVLTDCSRHPASLQVPAKNILRIPRYRGKLIAFVGSDGSGKTTLTSRLSVELAQDRPTTYVYLGLGSGDLGRRIGQLPVIGHMLEKKLSKKAKTTRTHGEKIPGSLTALVVYVFSLKRYFNHLKMQNALRAGLTVVTDRYPQAEIAGTCDGPGLSAAQPGNFFVAWLRKSEASLYQRMAEHHPDLIIHLDVSPQVAHQRKPDHDLELLQTKSEIMKQLRFGGARMVSIDASAPFQTVWTQVVHEIQPFFASHFSHVETGYTVQSS